MITRFLRDGGQTTTEYLMILGLVTAIIVALERIVIPTISWVVNVLLTHKATCVTTMFPLCAGSK